MTPHAAARHQPHASCSGRHVRDNRARPRHPGANGRAGRAALGDGRVALAGVPDYSPGGIPPSSWDQRLAIFWLPQWPQSRWASFSGDGSARLISRGPRERTLQVVARSPGRLTLMQWAHPHWRVQIRPAKGSWSAPLAAGGANPAGWVEVPLPRGTWDVALTYGKPR